MPCIMGYRLLLRLLPSAHTSVCSPGRRCCANPGRIVRHPRIPALGLEQGYFTVAEGLFSRGHGTPPKDYA